MWWLYLLFHFWFYRFRFSSVAQSCLTLCNLGPFIQTLLLIWTLYFSWWVWLKIFKFCLSFWEPVFGFIDLFYCLCVCVCVYHFIYFYSDLYFPFEFVFLFSVPLGMRLNGLFEISLTFWGRPVLLWISLLEQPLLYAVDFETLCLHFHLSQGFPFWFFSVV